MSGSARAELLADAGEAAAGRELFRSREFFAAERVTHTLRIDAPGTKLVAPVLVREIPGCALLDAISPYGYPGIVPAGGSPKQGVALDPSAVDWAPTGLVSLFIRHRLEAKPPLTGASERSTVQIADPALEEKSRASDRQQIRRNERAGYTLEVIQGPETTGEQLRGFHRAYTETMSRTGAGERYLYAPDYFATILASPLTRLALVRAPNGDLAAGSLVATSDAMLHYYLSGTADHHLGDSPMKTLLAGLASVSREEGLPLNLGGGITSGDRLEEFKRGFANREQPWHTSEIVCEETAYAELSGDAAGEGFFPAYRAPR